MFDTDRFIADCRGALDDGHASRNVRQIVSAAVADPAALMGGLGEPERGGIAVLHRSPELTVLNVIWHAGQIIMPHTHELWAVIGVYSGREDNILCGACRRTPRAGSRPRGRRRWDRG